MEQDAAVAWTLVDGVQALAQLVDRLVQQHLGRAIGLQVGHFGVAARQGVGDLALAAWVQQFVGGPFAPLHAIDRTQVVDAFSVGVGQPLGIFVGVLVPDLATQFTERGGAAHAAQEADHFADGGLEGQFFGGDGRKALLQVEAQRGARHAQRAYARPVFLPRAGVQDGLNEVQVLFHGNRIRKG